MFKVVSNEMDGSGYWVRNQKSLVLDSAMLSAIILCIVIDFIEVLIYFNFRWRNRSRVFWSYTTQPPCAKE